MGGCEGDRLACVLGDVLWVVSWVLGSLIVAGILVLGKDDESSWEKRCAGYIS